MTRKIKQLTNNVLIIVQQPVEQLVGGMLWQKTPN
jgi:hypothetical protein